MNYRFFVFIKFILLVIALGLASFLVFGDQSKNVSSDQKIVFVIDINRTMNTKDMLSGTVALSRLAAAKHLIYTIILSEPQYPYGLILFNAGVDYIIPPTLDTWTFLLYLSWITTNLLPEWLKDFSQLSGYFHNDYTSYVIMSDFDTPIQRNINFPRWTTLLWLGTLAGEHLRYANGILYYDNGKSIFSARNDQFANSLWPPYTTLTNVENFSVQKILSHGFSLPLSQRILLYAVLWILVVLVIFL